MALRSFSGGDGSAASPYLIASRADWEALAINVLLEQSYSGKYFKLTNDITIAYDAEYRFFMVGSAVKINASTTDMRRFEGIFDGNGHTLNFDFRRREWGSGNTLSFNEDYCAPFRYINNATIRNLKLTGSISTTQKYAAGLVAQASGSNTITNCRSSVNITGTTVTSGNVTYPPYHGGFVANVNSGTTTIEGCLFDGELHQAYGSHTHECGGFVGSSSGTVAVSNSLFYPASVEVEYGRTFINADNNATVNNCYFSQKIYIEQGKQLRRITAITGINLAPANTPTVYDVSGIASYVPGIKYNDVFYAGKGDAVSLNLSAASGYIQTGSFTASGGTVSGSANPYTLTLNNNTDDVTVNGGVIQSDWAGSGTQADPFQIKTTQDLNQLATNVNNGTSYAGFYFKVMNDIAYTYTSAWNANSTYENNYTRIGYYYSTITNGIKPFSGHFDGNGKTISGIRVGKYEDITESDDIGIFGYVDGNGEVKGITLSDTRFVGRNNIGGIVGYSRGLVTDCHVTATVSIYSNGSGSYYGGIVGYNSNSGVASHCSSAVTITYPSGPYNTHYGGIAGQNQGNLSDNIVIGATINAVASSGAIVGFYSEGVLARNYYTACTINNTANATNVGKGNPSGRSDVTENDGAVSFFYLYDSGTAANGNADIISSNAGSGKSVVLKNRSFYFDRDWNTLCLPFGLTAEQLAASPLAGATLMTLDGNTSAFDNTNGTLTLNFTDATAVEAGKPYLMKWKNGLTITDGTEGLNGAGGAGALSYLTDGIIDPGDGSSRKWCAKPSSAPWTWFVEFNTAAPISVSSYTMTTGNDTETYPNRNPRVWTLKAKLLADDEWILIDSREGGVYVSYNMPTTNFTSKSFSVTTPGTYRYFRLDIDDNYRNYYTITDQYIVQLSEFSINGTMQEPMFTGVTIVSADPSSSAVSSSYDKVSFTGTYTPISFSADDKSKLFLGSENTLYYPKAGASINAFRAYFQLKGITAGDPANGVRAFVLRFVEDPLTQGDNFGDEEANGIQPPSISPEGERTEASPRGGLVGAAWYSIDGRKLEGRPTAKGLYINNGKKVVIK